MNANKNSLNKIKNNSKINNTSSKPVKKMILWTRLTNSKSTSPHSKQNTNTNFPKNKLIKKNYSRKKLKNNSKEKSTSSPSSKTKEVSNFISNMNYLSNSRKTGNKVLNTQVLSFQSNSNEENKRNSKFGDSNSKKSEKKSHFVNIIKFKKYIDMNYSLNNNNNNNININSSEYHINNTYKYFQSSNGINLRKKNQNKIKNKTNFIADKSIVLNPSKKSINKKKVSIEKPQKKNNISKKNLYISPSLIGNPISPREKKGLTGSLNQLTADNINEKKEWNKIRENSFSDRNNVHDSEKIKILEKENKNLKKENNELNKKIKEMKILMNKLEIEILELKSVIKDNLNLVLQPEKDFMNKSYKDLIEQIEKQKINISKIINIQQKTHSNKEKESKLNEDNYNNINNSEQILLKDRRNDYRIFKKNFFEFYNKVNTSNTSLNGFPSGNDSLKNILNSFCCFMDNIMNKLEEGYIKLDKKENDKNNIYINNLSEVCLINIYYKYVIIQLFLVSFFERQQSYYCLSILDYILSSPFMIIKNNNYIKEQTKNINILIEVYKNINEEYINKFTEQTFFYLDNYIKLFNIIINNKIYLNNNIKLDSDAFLKNTNILFNKDNQKQKIYLDMINDLLEKIKKNNNDLNTERLFEKKINARNKINLIKLSGDNCDLISSLSNVSSKIIDNYSEKPSFFGYLKSEDCPPDMSLEEEDV